MHSYSSFAVAALAATAAASPIEQLAKRGTFTITQIPGPAKPAIPVLMRRTYAKFNGTLPQDVHIAAAAADTGSVPAIPEENDIEYLCSASVGGTTMHLNLDTGSADFWVYSNLQPASQTAGHDVYNPTKTGGKLITGASWKISYGDGSGAGGTVYSDKVVIGGVTATSQAVEAATSVSSGFQADVNTDGLVGLAFSKINTVKPTKQTTFFDTVKAQLQSQLFTVTLKKGVPGSYDFGYIDDKKYTGTINYVNADSSRGYWGLTVDGYSIGTGATTTSSTSAIVDTGTTLIYLPDAIVNAYYKAVPAAKYDNSQGGYTFACSTKLPDFNVIIGGKAALVPGTNINYAPVSRGSSTCFGGIQSNSGLGLSILGDIFLKSQFVVHDVSGATPRLGFAQQASTSGNGTAPATGSSTPTPAVVTPTPTPAPDNSGDDGDDGSWWAKLF